MAASTRAKTIALRVFIAHLAAYPVVMAWAVGSMPVLISRVAAVYGLDLSDAEITRHVLWALLWPVVPTALLEHLAGVVWGVDRNERRGKRIFVVSTLALLAIPILGGGASWIWLMTGRWQFTR